MYQLLAGCIVLRYLQEHEFVLRKGISKIICINYLLAVLCKGICRIMCTNYLLSVLSIGTVFKKIGVYRILSMNTCWLYRVLCVPDHLYFFRGKLICSPTCYLGPWAMLINRWDWIILFFSTVSPNMGPPKLPLRSLNLKVIPLATFVGKKLYIYMGLLEIWSLNVNGSG